MSDDIVSRKKLSLNWLPIESNPVEMNRFLENLGVPKRWVISDLVSLDEEFLKNVPRPVFAIILLLPCSARFEDHQRKVDKKSKLGTPACNPDLYFMYQSIENSCGSIALIHAIANCISSLKLGDNSIIKRFVGATMSLTPNERAYALEQNEEIRVALKNSVRNDLGHKCKHHYITLVNFKSKLFELDGDKENAVSHGATSEKTFLEDAAEVCMEYIRNDPDNIEFTALVFGAAPVDT